jgi:hypothetical protein
MERRHQRDQQLEGTTKPTEKAGKAGPRPWEIKRYIYQEEPRDEKGSSHSDPRLELARQSHDLRQDSHVIPHDGGPEQIHPAFGLGAMSNPHAHAFSASELGTLAGGWAEDVTDFIHYGKGDPPYERDGDWDRGGSDANSAES